MGETVCACSRKYIRPGRGEIREKSRSGYVNTTERNISTQRMIFDKPGLPMDRKESRVKAVDKEKREAFVKYRDEIRKARYAVTEEGAGYESSCRLSNGWGHFSGIRNLEKETSEL